MTSRLDRLFVLLEAGAGAATRQAAARQLGEVQKAHPEELHRLLARLMQPLRSTAWETRVAAAQAVEAILANVPEWHPPPCMKKEDNPDALDLGRLRCEQLDIERVLSHGAHLMASEGHEFDGDDDGNTGDVREKLAKQRALLNAKLGLDMANKLGIDLGEVYTAEDLCPQPKLIPKPDCARRPVQELMLIPGDKPLSSREMNVAKRKARQAAFNKQKSRDTSDEPTTPTTPDEPEAKRIKLEPGDEYLNDCSGGWTDSDRWPLDLWASSLQACLFRPTWEARHGAASALRELLKARISNGAGRMYHKDEDGHQEWLEDLALRLLCVLALDRFGDFVSDQVVAPVRETCAQTLGVAASRMRDDRAALVAQLLARLAAQPQWEARHGALLGFKYLLQAKPEVAMSRGALQHLVSGLSDGAEDVSAVAARALCPAAGALLAGPPRAARALVATLWALLREQDDLAAPANAYMALLAALMSQPEAHHLLYPIDLEDVLPRLWSYLQHSSTSIRKAALQTLRTMTRPLKSQGSNGSPEQLAWSCELLQACMRHVYQRILYEHVQDIQDVAMQVWSNLCVGAALGVVLLAACPLLASWLCAAMQPSRLAANTDLMPERRQRPNLQNLESEEIRPVQKWYIGGCECQPPAVRDRSIMRARCKAADALGLLSCYLVQPAPGIQYNEENERPIDCYVKVLIAYLSSSSALQRLVASLVIASWAENTAKLNLYPPSYTNIQPTLMATNNPPLTATNSVTTTATNNVTTTDTSSLTTTATNNVTTVATNTVTATATNSVTTTATSSVTTTATSSLNTKATNNVTTSATNSQPLRTENINNQTTATSNISETNKLFQILSSESDKNKNIHSNKPNNVPSTTANNQTLSNNASTATPNQSTSMAVNGHLVPESNGYTEFKIEELAPPLLKNTLHALLNQSLYYDEVAHNCNKILQEARDLVAMMRHYKLPLEGEEFINILRLEQVSHISTVTKPLVAAMKVKRVASNLEERRLALHSAVSQCATEQNTWHISVQGAIAGACAHLNALPEKLNPVMRPLMESLKKEEQEELQGRAARALGPLLAGLATRTPCPNHKVLANLKAFLRCDPEYTPKVSLSDNTEEESASGDSSNEGSHISDTPILDKYNGILTLWEQQRAVQKVAPKRGRPSTHHDLPAEVLQPHEYEARKLLRIQRRGANLALTNLTEYFGVQLPEKLPKLWEFITEPISRIMTDEELDNQDTETAEELISRLQVIETVSPYIHEALWPTMLKGTEALAALTRHCLTAVRHMAARCFSTWGSRSPAPVMTVCVSSVLPSLQPALPPAPRRGAAETLARLAATLRLQLLPYISLLILPLLGRMSDQCVAVRTMCTHCFATLIQLMPLDGAIPDPEGLSKEILERRERDQRFLKQLFNPKMIKDYKLSVPVSTELRSYQQAGVNWLRFLNEYNLHGVLCDDMGLGKTLQSIVVVAGDHWERDRAYRNSGAREHAPLPSLVVCPPTLTGHWVFEVNKFISSEYLRPLQYVGPPLERERLRYQVDNYNLVVASYDIVRKDIDFFSGIHWNYCILDEGHVIKNGKTMAFKAIKRLIANHRLILSGTPIQNNVLELWSLFDFLMPGLLGTERQFTAKYSRPILLAREPKPTPHQLQAGARAIEALHRQVLPFLLRRVKEDVLKELPPKITQDYYCELSPLQRKLYEHCSKSQSTTQNPHIFQALHYIQNVCNHPKLVLSPEHPAHALLMQELAAQRSSLDDINHAAKLPALKQLLLDCGIGAPFSSTEPVISQHRALVFCQLKSMLSIVETDLLQQHLPTVSYLRLDGSVPPAQRQQIVTRFNNDPSIDLLLLTTAVGGLGLNLTGADTVIFVEHDWNPMKDLQAMDRAHRIGQRKVVNVYRLVTRGTLEEKIMGLQKFKLVTANTVISSENAAIETMGTDKLLDLFQLPSDSPAPHCAGPGQSGSLLDSLPDLWDDKQYEEEYDMTNFIKSLHKMNS